MKKPLHVLLVEDSDLDALLIIETLQRGGYDPHWKCVETAKDMVKALKQKEWDIILSDYTLP